MLARWLVQMASVKLPYRSSQSRLQSGDQFLRGMRSAGCDVVFVARHGRRIVTLVKATGDFQSHDVRQSCFVDLFLEQVREFARQVQTNTKRVDATRSSRVLAERRLEAEEKKYQAGMTSSFFVLQAQRDLNVARNSELLALVEYAKSVVNFTAVQLTPLF